MASEYFADVNRAAMGQLSSLLTDWFPAGRLAGREYECGNLNGIPGKSFKVNIDSGYWADFAGNERGGDPVSLYAAIHGLKQGDAAMRLGAALGVDPPRPRAVKDQWEPVTPIPVEAPDPQGEGFPRWRPKEWGKLVGGWLYKDAQGRGLYYRLRFNRPGGGKDIRPLTWCRNKTTGLGEWRWRDLPAPRPLYNLELLAARPDAPVLVVEGEKTAEAAMALLPGWVVTTWSGGANPQFTDWRPLLERKTLIRLWPDADASGKKSMLAIAAMLPAGTDLRVVVPDPVWPEGWDLADGEAEGWTGARAEAWITEHSAPATAQALTIVRPPIVLATADHGELQSVIWEAVRTLNTAKPCYFWAKGGSRGELRLIERTPFDEDVMVIVDNPAVARAYLTRDFAFAAQSQWGVHPATPKAELMMSVVALPDRRLPILRRLVSTPIFVADGRLVSRPGYDSDSQIFYAPSPWAKSIEIPEHPTDSDRDAAKAAIEDVLHDFVFVTEADRANAYALMMLPLVREMITGPTPLHRLEAPEHGSGKSLLASVLMAPITREPFLIPETEDEEEWRKVLLSALRNGEEVINIDNCRHLNSSVLASLLTAWPAWGGRPLGQNDIVHYEISCIFISTVNNPEWSREMHRRMARIRIDPGVEEPYERTNFRHKQLIAYVRQRRPQLLRALLTLVRYGLEHATQPTRSKGSYEAWAQVMGSILGGLGMTDFLARIEEDRSVRQDGLRELVEVWWQAYESRKVRTSDLIGVADSIESLELGGRDEGGRKKSLGKFLKAAHDRIVAGKKIKTRISDGFNQFWLEEMDEI